MEITLRLPKSLSHLNNDIKKLKYHLDFPCNLSEFITMLESGMPGIQAELLNKNKNISDSINIYVNGENIRYLEGIQTILSDKDQVSIIPAAAAG